MRDRVVMARYDPSAMLVSDDPGCTCGCEFEFGEVIALYPVPEADNWRVREMVCMTCHFWFTHDVMELMGD
jgi:hypothetical protein